jgi:transcriptional regulator with XRE-family HTH domain
MNKLKEIRELKGLSQFELAKKADITPSDISRLENNKIFAYPGWRVRLSEALEVSEVELFPDNEDKEVER